MKTIIVAGGCFWGVEAYFKQLEGVNETEVGYINGDGTNPAIRVDNGAVVLAASAASNSKTFYGWLPISIAGTTKWIQMYN